MVVVHNRDCPVFQNTLIQHTPNHPGRQGLTQKASQTFLYSLLVQLNIIESIKNHFLDFQQLAKSAYFSILLIIIISYFQGLQQNREGIIC